MNIKCHGQAKLRLIDAATGRVCRETPWAKNIITDNGLNALARSTNATYPAQFASAVRVGSGSTPNQIASGAITFTQSGSTLTASAGFFTAGMVGWLFKWGTGTAGAENYITAYVSATEVTVGTSATVGTPEVGTVWNVAQSTLETLLYSSATYETTSGSCETTFSGGQVTHKRTINFAQQAGSYNVNEVGYFSSTGGTTVFGRIVLPATEVVPPTSFLQVVISVSFTYSPAAPTAVADVGTNIDTSGDLMLETLSDNNAYSQVTSNGGLSIASSVMDGRANPALRLITASYTQNATPGAVISPTNLIGPSAAWTYNSTRGQMRVYFNATISTAGQTLHGVGMGSTGGSNVYADLKLSTTYALPTGSFLPQTRFLFTYDRALEN